MFLKIKNHLSLVCILFLVLFFLFFKNYFICQHLDCCVVTAFLWLGNHPKTIICKSKSSFFILQKSKLHDFRILHEDVTHQQPVPKGGQIALLISEMNNLGLLLKIIEIKFHITNFCLASSTCQVAFCINNPLANTYIYMEFAKQLLNSCSTDAK